MVTQPAPAASQAAPRDVDVTRKTQAVVDYHHDPARPGRPLYPLLGGGAVAALAIALAVVMAYRTWSLHDIEEAQAYWGLSFLFCFYVLGIFLFSMGYELYDTARAVRLTLIVSVVSFLAVVLLIAVAVALTKIRGTTHAINSLARAADSDHGNAVLNSVISLTGGDENDEAKDERETWFGIPMPPPPPVDPVDFLITCPSCHRKFTPAPPKAICPWCNAPALSA